MSCLRYFLPVESNDQFAKYQRKREFVEWCSRKGREKEEWVAKARLGRKKKRLEA